MKKPIHYHNRIECSILKLRDAKDTNSDGISNIDAAFQLSVSGDELAIDKLTANFQYGNDYFPFDYPDERQIYFSPGNEVYISPNNEVYYSVEEHSSTWPPYRSDISGIPHGSTVEWWNNSGINVQMNLDKLKQTGRYQWKLEAFSPIGLLDEQEHVGGMYEGEMLGLILIDILGRQSFSYIFSQEVGNLEVWGWLPYDNSRRNLHRLLLSSGVSIRRTKDGYMEFVFLENTSPIDVPDERIDAMSGSVTPTTPITRVEVTEHAYNASASDEEVLLYDNTESGNIVENAPVRFDWPMHDLRVDGLTLGSHNCNYAIVSGTGKLYGKKYGHFSRIVSAGSTASGTAVKKLNDDFTTVSIANSQNVAARMLDYFQSAHTIKARIRLRGEQCGDVLSMHDPFYRQITAFLQSMDINVSSWPMADCTLIENYVPSHQGNNLHGHEMLTGAGTWVSPITGTITVVVVSGGQGGSPGHKGADAPAPSVASHNWSSSYGGENVQARYIPVRSARGGKGGDYGTPGSGGRYVVTTIEVVAGQQIEYSCGIGGAGALYSSGEDAPGELGTDTIFGEITTAGGTVSETGYIDPISGDRLGQVGENGINGGDGVGWAVDENDQLYLNTPDAIVVDGIEYLPGAQGITIGPISTNQNNGYGLFSGSIPGGYGGGAAYKRNGLNGTRGELNIDPGYRGQSSSRQGYAVGTYATGGRGANALPPPTANGYGRGGTSGNGGGGGGAAGVGWNRQYSENNWLSSTCYVENRYNTHGTDQHPGDSAGRIELNGTHADGGNGSDGGRGGDGCTRIFW